jgi:hypothetical protein
VAYFAVYLTILSVVSYVTTLEAGQLIPTSNTDIDHGSSWLFSASKKNITVLSDLDTLGKVQIIWSQSSLHPDDLALQHFDSQRYDRLVNYSGDRGETQGFDYLFIDKESDKPTRSLGWEDFEPLSKYLSNIERNPEYAQVYDDGSCLILKSVSSET